MGGGPILPKSAILFIFLQQKNEYVKRFWKKKLFPLVCLNKNCSTIFFPDSWHQTPFLDECRGDLMQCVWVFSSPHSTVFIVMCPFIWKNGSSVKIETCTTYKLPSHTKSQKEMASCTDCIWNGLDFNSFFARCQICLDQLSLNGLLRDMSWQCVNLSSALPTASRVRTVTGLIRYLSQYLLVTLNFSTGPNLFVLIGVS